MQAANDDDQFAAATGELQRAVDEGEVAAASLYVRQRNTELSRSFGDASSTDSLFLLASISKPISVAALMSLFDRMRFDLDDPVRKFIPEFTGDGREEITIRQLLTHLSGLPDQLPENAELRARHAPLSEFVARAITTPLLFAPGTRYGYSSMGILLASEVARRISGTPFTNLVEETVFAPLKMKHSALGVGRLPRESLMRCQTEAAAPESGAGDPASTDWDWNSDYWRTLGAPWGGAHGSAADVGRFLDAFLHPTGRWLRPHTLRLMVADHNPPGARRRGLGFDLGSNLTGREGFTKVFGHSGSTGTLCWADPVTDTLCVILTTLPAGAANPHPRETTSAAVAAAVS